MTIDVFSTRLETAQPPGIATIDVFSIRLETAPPAAASASIDVFGIWMETSADSIQAQRFICWHGALVPVVETGIAWDGALVF